MADRSTLPRRPYPNEGGVSGPLGPASWGPGGLTQEGAAPGATVSPRASTAGSPPRASTGQRAPAPPGERRLPGAPRERKPVLAALAVLLVAGGAAASALVVIKTGHKVAAIEVSQRIGAGQQISLGAMEEVSISADTPIPYVPWSERAQVARYYAAAAIPAGTLLTPRMVVQAGGLTTGRQLLGLTLKPGQIPAALTTGDHVDIYDTNTTTQNSCPGLPGATLTRDAIVTGLAFPGSSSGSNNVAVDIALNPPDAGQVACNAANGWAAIGIVPAGGNRGGQAQPSAAPVAGPQSPARSPGDLKKRRASAPPASGAPTVPAGQQAASASPDAPPSPRAR
jgi:hypothetical protein